MITVDEIDVGVAGRSEQDRGAGRVAGGGVSGGIVLSEIGFDFDDAGGETGISFADQNFAEKVASCAAGAAGEERATERANGPKRRTEGRKHTSGCRTWNSKVKVREWIAVAQFAGGEEKLSSFARRTAESLP